MSWRSKAAAWRRGPRPPASRPWCPWRQTPVEGRRNVVLEQPALSVVEGFSLRDKAALVIGASGPIGRAIAVALAEAGDAASESDVQALVERAVAELGRLDVLVNAHDLPYAKPFPEITPEEWRRVLDVNLTGAYLACRAPPPPMP